MSLVPLLFRDWWDDFDRERPCRILDQHFGLGLNRDDLLSSFSSVSPSVLRPGRYFRPWRDIIKQPTGASNITNNDKHFQVILDVQQFAPGEITVKLSGQSVVVEGKHEEKQDEHGYISRHFIRRYVMPKDVEIENTVSSLSSDGVLTVSVPKKNSISATGERIVEIQQTGVPAIKPAAETPIKFEPSKETQIKIEQT